VTPDPPVPPVVPRPPAGRLEEVTGSPPPHGGNSERSQPRSDQRQAQDHEGAPAELAGRFSTAYAALAFVGELIAAGQFDGSGLLHDEERGTCWVISVLPPALGRELVMACGGRTYLRQNGSFIPERGWGSAGPLSAGHSAAEPAGQLARITPQDLVRLAGLHAIPRERLSRALVLVPGRAVAALVRRSLELGLRVTHRPVELTPLFAQADTGDGEAASASREGSVYMAVELGCEPGKDEEAPPLPAALVAALDRDPFQLLCRVAGEGLLVQHGLGSALTDSQLLTLIPKGQCWLLADAAFGCALVRDLGEPRDSSGLVMLDSGYRIEPCRGGLAETAVQPVTVQVVPGRTGDAAVDAVLLDEADLPVLALILQDHRLAELAWLVRGGDRHLLLAAGGLLERLPVGEALTCVGPGALYLPVGYRLSPAIPPSARAELFGATAERAVVLRPGHGWEFDVSRANRTPVWTLWAGAPPDIRPQLTREAVAELEAVEAEFRPPAPPRVPRSRNRFARPIQPETRQRSWRDEAFEAEMAGDLAAAAKLFEDNGEPLRAAHLYETQARSGGPSRARQ
jgi:hypothetical protein